LDFRLGFFGFGSQSPAYNQELIDLHRDGVYVGTTKLMETNGTVFSRNARGFSSKAQGGKPGGPSFVAICPFPVYLSFLLLSTRVLVWNA
jgi:hypothetical protein